MPQAAQQHRQQQIAIGIKFPVTIAAERDIEIIAKPGTQTDVPTPPEILNAISQIRLAEIHNEMKSHQLGTPARDAAVPAEIAINLPSEGVRSRSNTGRLGWRNDPPKAAFAINAQLSAITHLRKSPSRIRSMPSKAFAESHRLGF